MDATGDLFAGQRSDGRARNPVLAVEKPLAGPVFFAITPDANATADAERTARLLRVENGLTGVPYPPEVLHVSLRSIGRRPRLPREVVEAACHAAAAVTMPPFEVAFDRAGSFNRTTRSERQSDWPFVMFGGDGVIGIEMLQRALINELNKVGFDMKKRSFEPHMTLLFDRRQVPAHSIAPVRWRVREFFLIHSLHGHTRHVRLARWKLSGQ
jgi:2'-5' RNA ligase